MLNASDLLESNLNAFHQVKVHLKAKFLKIFNFGITMNKSLGLLINILLVFRMLLWIEIMIE